VEFIETRQAVQEQAFAHIKNQLDQYEVETRGVYIQDVIFPQDLVVVLTQREIANQEVLTFQKQREAQEQRITMEQSKGTADMQSELAKSRVGVEIQTNRATARKAEADGEATYIRQTGMAKGAEVEAVGLARAKAYREQVQALGQVPTTIVNAITALAERNAKIVPDILVVGTGGGSLDGLAATLMSHLTKIAGGGQAGAKPG
jgi:hypothetical protein